MDKYTPQQLMTEILRLQRRVHDLEDEVALLRTQNDFLQELITPQADRDSHERDTIPAKPSSEKPTKPSSPRAIKLEDLYAALEASDSARLERDSDVDMKWDACPICKRIDEHEHDVDLGPEPDDGDLN